MVYFQDNTEEKYDFKCKTFEMDKYMKGQSPNRLPMIQRKTVLTDLG